MLSKHFVDLPRSNSKYNIIKCTQNNVWTRHRSSFSIQSHKASQDVSPLWYVPSFLTVVLHLYNLCIFTISILSTYLYLLVCISWRQYRTQSGNRRWTTNWWVLLNIWFNVTLHIHKISTVYNCLSYAIILTLHNIRVRAKFSILMC